MADVGIKRLSKLFICATPQGADLNRAGYEALTWVEITKIVTLPDFGVTDNIVSQDYIATDVSQKQKGYRSASDTELVVGRDHADAGQDIVRAAALTRSNYALMLVGSDSPNASATTNTIRYSRGVIGGPNFTGGGGEDFDNETFQIGLNQLPIVVDPEAII
jgi:hypothetical protein